ncbi:hypothetical protein H8F22_11275 [Pseudomonas sp. P154a]|uniref:hypothetical protein n=1 Tax=Pseudomonas mucoides TaxID=2730424 RepID=UPI0018926084|nr:hypothetical protein [Pseudomonas mucoides]MBF6039453.1 hypothetical protein [Pseudomonas mucoides]
MNQTIRQSQAILQGLRLQTSQATNEMYQRIGRDEPIRILNYTVVPHGGITVEVVERSSGSVKGEPFSHYNDCQFAASHKPAKAFARSLLRWTTGSALLLLLFAYFGAGN